MSNQQSSHLLSLHEDGLYLLNLKDTTSLKLGLPFTLPTQTELACILHCRGMLCLTLKDNDELVIWNPSTKQIKTVPIVKPGQTKIMFGFGYDRFLDDYKIVTVINRVIYIFPFKESCWRESKHILSSDCFFKDKTGTVVDHCMYWIANRTNNEKFIFCFDFVNEDYLELNVPMMLSGLEFNSWLGVSRGELCVINYYPSLDDGLCICRGDIRKGNKITRWDSDPWINIARNNEEPIDIRFACIARNDEVFIVVRCSGEEEEDKVLVYNEEDNKFVEVPFYTSFKGFRCMSNYVQSLSYVEVKKM